MHEFLFFSFRFELRVAFVLFCFAEVFAATCHVSDQLRRTFGHHPCFIEGCDDGLKDLISRSDISHLIEDYSATDDCDDVVVGTFEGFAEVLHSHCDVTFLKIYGAQEQTGLLHIGI